MAALAGLNLNQSYQRKIPACLQSTHCIWLHVMGFASDCHPCDVLKRGVLAGLQTVSKKRESSPEARAARTRLKRLRKQHATRTPAQPAFKMPGQPAEQGVTRDAEQRRPHRQ